jgi:membrane-associated phospholipid phosphatase
VTQGPSELPRRPNADERWVARAALGVGLLAGSWAVLRSPTAQRADVRVGDALRRAGSPAVDRAVTATTDLGSVYAVVGIAAVLAATRRRRLAADVLGIGLLTWNGSQWSKTRVRRQRPYEAHGVRRLIRPPTGSSFPSGHAAVGMAVMTVLAGQARTPLARRVFQALGAYVGASRVYVGVHYPTDVIGGAGMGLVLGAMWRGRVASTWRRLLAAVLTRVRGPRPVPAATADAADEQRSAA